MSKAKPPSKRKPRKKVNAAGDQAAELVPAIAAVPVPAIAAAPEVTQPSGWAKVKAAGKKVIMLSVQAWEYDRIRAAAVADRRSMAGWIVNAALRSLPEEPINAGN